MIRGKQVQDISSIKINIGQILEDCSSLKPYSGRNPFLKRSFRLKTQPCIKFNVEKNIDFDSCVKNINKKVRSLQSVKLQSLPLFKSKEKKKMSMSEDYIRDTQNAQSKSPSRTKNNTELAKSFQLPCLFAKFQRAFSPRNASSSEKLSLFQKQKSHNQGGQEEEVQKHESYQSIMGERKRKQELSYLLVMGQVVKENLVKERKVLQERKKKRKLESLKMREIQLIKRSLPN